MATTRRSSFGVQDGDTLALRSRSVPASANTTPSRKRKENGVGGRPSSGKKRKSVGNDGADKESGELVAQPTSGSVGILNGDDGEPEEPKSWLEDDFVPLSSGTPKRESKVEQEAGVAQDVEQAESRGGHALDIADKDTKDQSAMMDSKSKESADQGSRGVHQETNKSVAKKLPAQVLNPSVHKRFGSEEPVVVDGEAANTRPLQDEQEAGSAHGGEDGTASSDDDAPEIFGSRSVVKDVRAPVKPPRKAKRKLKSSQIVHERVTATNAEPTPAEEDLFFADPLPEQVPTDASDVGHSMPEPGGNRTGSVSTQQRPPKRKLFDDSERKPKDVIKDGVTYRTVSGPLPVILASKRHKTSHLPPKSNTSSWRLKKQVLGRTRVQHIWGGRSTFLRS